MKGKILSYQRGLDDALLLATLKEANLNEVGYNYRPCSISLESRIPAP